MGTFLGCPQSIVKKIERQPLTPSKLQQTLASLGMEILIVVSFDQNGRFIEGYYMVGLLASSFLDREPGAAIAYDPRLTWNTEAIVQEAGGRPIMSKTGHAFFKATLKGKRGLWK